MTHFDLRRTASLGLVAVGLALAACGSTTNLKVEESTRITKGQELSDLIKARELGALSDSEYQELRARIMRRAQ